MLNVIRTVMLNVICDSNGIGIIKYFDGFCMSYSAVIFSTGVGRSWLKLRKKHFFEICSLLRYFSVVGGDTVLLFEEDYFILRFKRV